MKKTSLLLLSLFCLCLTCLSQINKDTIPNQLGPINDLLKQPVVDSSVMIEKVYLHIDRTYYYPGDDVWFKAYLINALDRLLTDHSSNLHVELISPSSKIVSSTVIRLDSCLGNGDFKLAADLRSGRYKIIAYTNYMRNFGEELFFKKEIFVINSDDDKDDTDEQVKYVENKIELSFFPEAGSLIDNVSSLVAFKDRIAGVSVVGHDGVYKIYIRSTISINGSSEPLFLIDGKPVFLEDFISMPIFLVERIDVLKSWASTNIFGFMGSNGVLNLITKAGGGTYSGGSHSANIRISGYDVARVFYSPTHLKDPGSDYNPDLRSTLLWKPDINLDGNKEVIVKYYNGDNSSLVRIIAEGITSTGIPVTGKAEYEIRQGIQH